MVKMGKVFHCDSWMCGIVGVHWKGEGEVGLLRVFLTDLFVKYRSWLMEVLSVYTSRCQLFKTPLFSRSKRYSLIYGQFTLFWKD